MTKETIFENNNYVVAINREADDFPYEVVNKQHDVVEARETNKPQALILAKQFDMLLTNDLWAQQLDEMYGTGSKPASLYSIN